MHYIVRHTGNGQPDTTALQHVLDLLEIRIIDDSDFPNMALLDNIKEKRLPELRESLPGGWELYPERMDYAVPDARQIPGLKSRNR